MNHPSPRFARNPVVPPLAALVIATFLAAPPAFCTDSFTPPPIENLERLASWRAGVAAADARERPLQIVCIGDSNTEGPAFVGELRWLLQGCYGERGIGYHSLGIRAPVPNAPEIRHAGDWTFLRDAPQPPPPPYFAMDGIWCQTDDPDAEISVSFAFGNWAQPANPLARAYNIQQRIRIHHQVGPGLGAFSLLIGEHRLKRIDCDAPEPGYAVSEAFLADGFRIGEIDGRVVLFGFDARRTSYLQGQPVLRGGVLVHALGKGWGMAAEPAAVEEAAYAAFFDAIRPDLILIMLGTNDQHNDGRVQRYHDHMTTLIGKLRAHSPGTGILVVACPEAPQTREGLAAEFRDAARDVAAANDAAFWNLQDLIGPRSEVWIREGLFADSLHYSAIGGSVMARMLLAQLGFDLQDPRRYPVLAQRPAGTAERSRLTIPRIGDQTLDTLAAAIADATAQPLWIHRERALDLRLAMAGDALGVHARVFDALATGPRETWDAGNVELCIANPSNIGRVRHNEDGPIVRQVIFPATQGKQAAIKQFTMDEENRVIEWTAEDSFPWRLTALDPHGYELTALIPLALLALERGDDTFLLEAAMFGAVTPGTPPSYNRMFAVRGDAGAFRDTRQSAVVTVE